MDTKEEKSIKKVMNKIKSGWMNPEFFGEEQPEKPTEPKEPKQPKEK